MPEAGAAGAKTKARRGKARRARVGIKVRGPRRARDALRSDAGSRPPSRGHLRLRKLSTIAGTRANACSRIFKCKLKTYETVTSTQADHVPLIIYGGKKNCDYGMRLYLGWAPQSRDTTREAMLRGIRCTSYLAICP